MSCCRRIRYRRFCRRRGMRRSARGWGLCLGFVGWRRCCFFGGLRAGFRCARHSRFSGWRRGGLNNRGRRRVSRQRRRRRLRRRRGHSRRGRSRPVGCRRRRWLDGRKSRSAGRRRIARAAGRIARFAQSPERLAKAIRRCHGRRLNGATVVSRGRLAALAHRSLLAIVRGRRRRRRRVRWRRICGRRLNRIRRRLIAIGRRRCDDLRWDLLRARCPAAKLAARAARRLGPRFPFLA